MTILEDVAKKMWNDCEDSKAWCIVETRYLKLAQEAINALDIIILPKDAEPEVGDVMVGSGIMCIEVFLVDYAMLNSPSNLEKRLLKGRIIQRNGKPVLYKEKSDE